MTIMKKARSGVTSLLFAATILPSIAMAQSGPEVSGRASSAAVSALDVKVCCPPVAENSFSSYFTHHQLPGKNITQTYGLSFTPSTALDAQMKAYAPFAALFAPATWTGHSVMLDAEMKELSLPITSTPTIGNFNTGTPVHQGKLRGWLSNGTGVWTGTAVAWAKRFNDGGAVSPNFMKPGKWYMTKLTLKLGSNKPGVPGSWREDNITCMTKYVVYMVPNVPLRSAVAGSATSADIKSFDVK